MKREKEEEYYWVKVKQIIYVAGCEQKWNDWTELMEKKLSFFQKFCFFLAFVRQFFQIYKFFFGWLRAKIKINTKNVRNFLTKTLACWSHQYQYICYFKSRHFLHSFIVEYGNLEWCPDLNKTPPARSNKCANFTDTFRKILAHFRYYLLLSPKFIHQLILIVHHLNKLILAENWI